MKIREMKRALLAAFQARVESIQEKTKEADRLEQRARAIRDHATQAQKELERTYGISLNGELAPAAPRAETAPKRRARRARRRRTANPPPPAQTGSTGLGAHILHMLKELGRPATKHEIAASLRKNRVHLGRGLGGVNLTTSRLVRAGKLRETDGKYAPSS